MIVVHAPGGGLGHLTRVAAAHHTLGWTGPVVVLSTSSRVGALALPHGTTVERIPREVAGDRASLRTWLEARLRALDPDELWVDALPAGLRGELDQDLVEATMGDRPVHHLARLVRWSAYRAVLPARPLRFSRTHLTEPLHTEHLRWSEAQSRVVAPLALTDPPPPDGADDAPVDPSTWLVVHAGTDDEVLDLVEHARERMRLDTGASGPLPRLVLCTPAPRPDLLDALPSEVTVHEQVPAWPLFPLVARVVAAAGANTVRQVLVAGAAHHLVPLPRRWDDQAARAAHARRQTFPLRP